MKLTPQLKNTWKNGNRKSSLVSTWEKQIALLYLQVAMFFYTWICYFQSVKTVRILYDLGLRTSQCTRLSIEKWKPQLFKLFSMTTGNIWLLINPIVCLSEWHAYFKLLLTWFILSLLFLYYPSQTGPGLVFMKWSSSLGDGIFLHSVTPKEPLLQSMRHTIYASKSVPTVVVKCLLYAEAIQVKCEFINFVLEVIDKLINYWE